MGPVDILVNNAGVIEDDLFVRLEPEAWNKVLADEPGRDVQLLPGHRLFDDEAPQRTDHQYIKRRGQHVNPGQTNYAASKGAINSFTRALAVELASRGVTVNAIAPGFIETDMSAAVRNKAGDLIKKMIPMRRLGTAGGHRQGGGLSGQRREQLHHGPGDNRGWRLEPRSRIR